MCKIVILMAATLAVLSGQVLSQTAPVVPQTCSQVDSLNWNNTALFGNWIEVARNPIGNTPACVQYSVELQRDNVTLLINATHSSSNTSLYQNVDEYALVTLVSNSNTGYNVTFIGANSTATFIKLLQIVNSTYLIGCGYTNASDVSTSYGFILSKNSLNATEVQLANNNAAQSYSNFEDNKYGNITQVGCYRSSAEQSLPLISGILALALLLVRAQ